MPVDHPPTRKAMVRSSTSKTAAKRQPSDPLRRLAIWSGLCCNAARQNSELKVVAMTICLCHGGICELSVRCSWPPCPNMHQVLVQGQKCRNTGSLCLDKPMLSRGTYHGTHVQDISQRYPSRQYKASSCAQLSTTQLLAPWLTGTE